MVKQEGGVMNLFRYVVETIIDNKFVYVGCVSVDPAEVAEAVRKTGDIVHNMPSKFAEKAAKEKFPEILKGHAILVMDEDEWEEKFGGLEVNIALMDKDGRFVELGDCTIADPRIQSALWDLHEYTVSEDSQRVYVKPLVIIQIQYTAAFEGSLCRNWQFNWTSGGYVAFGSRGFYKLRHPRFLRFRPDKQVSPEDLRLEQVRNGE